MKRAGQIALMPFPFTDLTHSKKRPVLLLRRLDHARDDWLVCMISSRLHQTAPGLDWVLMSEAEEFAVSGLKVSSVFRLSRVAVLDGVLLLGSMGTVTEARLYDLRRRLSRWIACEADEEGTPA
ncbi:PemK family protein [Halorhodospira abdelmalekii]|uniref:type II toxin-antitoxin system PemK/MazF family toxin n=1 Tax=Halorhodospira abdelmalekii TaxID=421629 RepID=UPI0019063121|nr:type II toxin-antitoxin system PemK/MazF family toxin [Halorhodospira abdelmalekii]MBK1736307.1 PemK family protein [Halorhodospira abdelmalekii]